MTEEQKEIVLLGSRIEILNKHIDFSKDGIIEREEAIKAMQEYAELYHVAQLSKLRQGAVSDSACDNIECVNGKVNVYGADWQDCIRCIKKQTDC